MMITQTIPPLTVIICNLINQKIPPAIRECGARLNKEASCTQKDMLTSSKKVKISFVTFLSPKHIS